MDCGVQDVSSVHQGSLESLQLALGGSVVKAGALTDCPFQDASGYNSGNPSPPEVHGDGVADVSNQ